MSQSWCPEEVRSSNPDCVGYLEVGDPAWSLFLVLVSGAVGLLMLLWGILSAAIQWRENRRRARKGDFLLGGRR